MQLTAMPPRCAWRPAGRAAGQLPSERGMRFVGVAAQLRAALIWALTGDTLSTERKHGPDLPALVKLGSFNESVVIGQPCKQPPESFEPKIILTNIPPLVEVQL